MRKLRNLLGMPVLCQRRRLGRLMQAELSRDLTRLEGIWVDGGLRGTRYVPAEQLAMIGEVAVLSDGRGTRRRCDARPLFLRAVDAAGERVGAIVGAEVDELSFQVRALELTRGLWDELWRGRERVERFTAQPERGLVIVSEAALEADKEEER